MPNESVTRIRANHYSEACYRASMAAYGLDCLRGTPNAPLAREHLLAALAELDAAERVSDPEE